MFGHTYSFKGFALFGLFSTLKALHTLGILSTSFTWNAFPTVLKEFPHMLSTCWKLNLHSAVQLIPNHLNWVEVRCLWRPGQLMQHPITLLLCQIALTQPGGGLGHCPDKKNLTKTQRLELKISHFLVQASLFFILVSYSGGFFAAIRP